MLKRVRNWFLSTPRVRVASFHTGRCGSTVLGNLANAHPKIQWNGEIFHAWNKNISTPEFRQQVGQPLNILRDQLRRCESQVYGFETKFKHLDEKGLDLPFDRFVAEIEYLGVTRFVVLKRKNLLRQAISLAAGRAVNKWHFSKSEPAPDIKPVHLDLDNVLLAGVWGPILERFEAVESAYRDFEKVLSDRGVSAERTLKLVYESDIQDDPIVAYRKLCGLCGVSPVDQSPDLRRVHARPLPELISNYAEVTQLLGGTKYGWMVNESGS